MPPTSTLRQNIPIRLRKEPVKANHISALIE
jgi:hypothetical protein